MIKRSIIHFSFLLILSHLITSCTETQQELNYKTNKPLTKDSVKAPLEISVSLPQIVNPDSCQSPVIINVPNYKSKYTPIRTLRGFGQIKLTPPEKVKARYKANLKKYNTEHGLAISTISFGKNSMFIDKSGRLWIATQGGGISCFDGQSFTNYTTENGLPENHITCFSQDSIGNIWIGTAGNGVSCYNGRVFKNYNTNDGLVSNSVYSSALDKKGHLWFGTIDGVSRFDGKEFKTYNKENGLPHNTILKIYPDKEGNIWFGTNGAGVSCFDGNTFKNFNVADGLPHRTVLEIINDKNGNIWFGTYLGGASRFYDNNFTTYDTSKGLIHNFVNCMVIDQHERLFFGTEQGISIYDNSFININKNHALPDALIKGLLVDKNNSLWIGTEGDGIINYDGGIVNNFNLWHGLLDHHISYIAEDKNDNMWFCTPKGIICFDGKSFINYTISQGLVYPQAKCVTVDKNNNIWIGTDNGVSVFNGTSFVNYTMLQGLSGNLVSEILIDSKEHIWFATDNGLSKFDGINFTNFSEEYGFSNKWCNLVTEDGKGNIWFTQEDKLKCYDGKSLKTYSAEQGFVDYSVSSIFEDNSGFMWFGSDGGLSRFDGKTFINFTTKNGLVDNNIYAISQNKDGVLWVGTNKGLSAMFFKKGNKQPSTNVPLVPAGALKVNNKELINYEPFWEIFNISTGHPIKDVNSNALFCDSKGNIWAGTGDKETALVKIDYKLITKNEEPITVVLKNIKIENNNVSWYNLKQNKTLLSPSDSLARINEEVLLFGKELTQDNRSQIAEFYKDVNFDSISSFYPIPQKLVLPYKLNNLTFEFNAIQPANYPQVRYKYILEGYDNDWCPETDVTSATYGNIHEGTYVFKIKTLSPDGIWSKPLEYKFTVLPPWWRTLWARVLMVIIALAILTIIYRIRIKVLNNQKLNLEKLVQERTLELKNKNDRLIDKTRELNETNTQIEEQAEDIKVKSENLKEVNKLLIEKQELILKQSDELLTKNEELSLLNDTKDKFFSIIAHDLKSPFNTIIGFSNLLTNRYDSFKDDKRLELLEIINDSSTKLFNLLENLLKWARSQTGELEFSPQQFVLNEIIDTNISLAEQLLKSKKLSIKKELKDNVLVFADIDMIDTVLRNLLSNAIKFTDSGFISLKTEKEDNHIKVLISDTGVGIPKDRIGELFSIGHSKSTRGTRGEKGTGLGLVLCKDFIKKNQGTILVESIEGQGTTFIITIPLFLD